MMVIASLFLLCSAMLTTAQECSSPWSLNATWSASPFQGALCNAPERAVTSIPVAVGFIPPWLAGTLFRNVPAQYSFGEDDVRHWFDGMGMFHTLELDPTSASVWSKSRFANTTSFAVMQASHAYEYTGFGTYPRPGPLGSDQGSSSEGLGIVVNNDVSFAAIGGKFFATTDRAGFVEFDPDTLATITPESFAFSDNLTSISGHGLGLTHGPYDAETGEYFNYVSDAMMSVVGGPTQVYLYKINATAQWLNSSLPWSRQTVGVIETVNNTYAHSMGLTEHFVVWVEQRGLIVSELELALGSTIMDAMHPIEQTSVFRLVDRQSGVAHRVEVSDPNFGCMFHSGNTFEDVDGSVVYDMVTYPDCTGYRSLSIEGLLAEPDKVMPHGRFQRCRISPDFGAVSCGIILAETYSSFPWYNKNFHKRPYRFAYTTDIARVSRNPSTSSWNTTASVNKIDLSTNMSVAMFSRDNYLFTEALFVPEFPGDHDPAREDAGALVMVTFNVETSLSEVFALNATDLQVIFAVPLPFAIPLHFHGIFCGPKPLSQSQRQFCLWN